jgi:lipopolysaccharide transport system permease protein
VPLSGGQSPVSTLIEPVRGWSPIDLGELWRYRDVVLQIAGMKLRVRYRQSMLGAVWIVAQPLMLTVVFAIFFSLRNSAPTTSGLPYALSVLTGLAVFDLFSSVLNGTANSLNSNRQLITRVYCPRLVFPLSETLVALVDYAISFTVLLAIGAFLGALPTMTVLIAPLFGGLAAITGLGAGLIVAALSVRVRDLRFMLPTLLRCGFFLSPVIYEMTALVPKPYQPFYLMNPVAVAIESFRTATYGVGHYHGMPLAVAGVIGFALMLIGLTAFRRSARTAPDYL